MKNLFFLILFTFIVFSLNAQSTDVNTWDKIPETINNSFYFVVDKIVDIQGFFIKTAILIGRVVLLIAILSAALNYALTGQGLKENIIKILKASLFFLIVIPLYPRIIGAITSWTFDLADGSVGKSVSDYFGAKTELVKKNIYLYEEQSHIFSSNPYYVSGSTSYYKNKPTYSARVLTAEFEVKHESNALFASMTATRTSGRMTYKTVAPASLLQIILLLAGDCIHFADNAKQEAVKGVSLPEFSGILKGLICAFFLILTGVFALLEYIVCFLEFMLVASVGVILFPFSIWEGTKFISEGFIKAIFGFFMKLLFCNIAVFLLLYGFISLFYFIQENKGFQGEVGQIVFIIFTCLLFFYICKSSPGVAQSLLSGTPSLSATGAISAVGGAVAAAGATIGMARSAGNKALSVGKAAAGGIARAGVGAVGSLSEAGAMAKSIASRGGTRAQQVGAFSSSLWSDTKDSINAGALGLTRSLLGGRGGVNAHSWRDDFANKLNADGTAQTFEEHREKRKQEGVLRADEFAKKHNI